MVQNSLRHFLSSISIRDGRYSRESSSMKCYAHHARLGTVVKRDYFKHGWTGHDLVRRIEATKREPSLFSRVHNRKAVVPRPIPVEEQHAISRRNVPAWLPVVTQTESKRLTDQRATSVPSTKPWDVLLAD